MSDDNPFNLLPHIEGKDADELVVYLAQSGARPGSPVHMAITTALQVRIARCSLKPDARP